jgi:LuxR family transcriptional regulator, positive regulator of biofilm formation
MTDKKEIKKYIDINSPNKKVFILGSFNLHNELLLYTLKKEFNIECLVLKTIEEIAKEDKSVDSINLILIDSIEYSIEEVFTFLATKSEKPLTSYIVALFNLQNDSGLEMKALNKNVRGFFYTVDSLNLLLKGVRALLNGEVWISRNILVECVMDGFKHKRTVIEEKVGITDRELEILSLVSMGATNEEIAKKIFISPHTVKTHIYKIFKKINVKNRLQAALWFAENT